jgi:C1A family cysteine protease
MSHKLNWKSDLPDFRDFKYSLHRLKVSPVIEILPTKVDLRPFCSPVLSQGNLGSCTSWSLAGHLEFLELKEIREKISAPEEFDPNVFTPFSRLFIYYGERVLENSVDSDSGAQIRDGIKVLNQFGDCSEVQWPYIENNVFVKPSDSSYQEALNHRISTYMRLETLDDIRHCLASGYPVSFGFSVFSSFESEEVARTGIVPVPAMTEEMVGGHAVLAVGYDDTNNWLIVKNSWGSDWGDKGYFYLPYTFITDGNLSDDFWTIRR